MSTQGNSWHDDVPDYAKADAIPYHDGPYYEYPSAARPPSQAPAGTPSQAWPAAPVQHPIGVNSQTWPGASFSAAPPVPGPPAYQPWPGGPAPIPSLPPPRRPWSTRRRMFVIVGVLIALLVFAGGGYALFTLIKPIPEKSAFAQSSCPFKPGSGITEGSDVTCGFLTVPENHSQPQGRTIRLAAAVFKVPHASTSSLPVLYLTGGPGGGALGDLGRYITSANLNEITLGHDLIVLDQRGTGYSQPALNCQEFDNLQRNTQDTRTTQAEDLASYTKAAQQCRDRLTANGTDLNSYSTIENARDVHDLIQALGYQQVNLYGVSYGTRLALTVMRLFPQDIRSVVLDSTVPTQINLFNTYSTVTQHAYDTLFKGCSASTTCKSEYPQLQDEFYKIVTNLNARPVELQDSTYGTLLLTGDSFASWLFTALYVTQFIPYLPGVIHQVSQGQYQQLTKLYGELMFQGGISDGMYYSVECGEDMKFTNLPTLEKSVQVMHTELRQSMLEGLRSSYAVCQLWGQQPVPSEQKQAVKSDIPTLILSGEYDPITPLTNAEMAAQTLSKSHVLVFPATGHGVFLTGQCPNTVIQAFWERPTDQPAGTCIPTMHEPDFV
jgi:pimeloyl-ACP methyl ester carboxylesterase